MTYADAWKLTSQSTYAQASQEGWGDEWMAAEDHITSADYDLDAGIIDNVTDYDK